MKGFSQDARYLYFLMDYIPGGELFTYLRAEGKLESDHAMYEIQKLANNIKMYVIGSMLPK